jgi:hypothetical protein
MSPCIVRIFQHIYNKTQRYTVYLYLKTALHVSGGTSTHHQKRIQLYLQYLVFVRPLLEISNSSTIASGSSNGVTNTRCCRYSCIRSWWWVEIPPETCTAVPRYNKLCNVASLAAGSSNGVTNTRFCRYSCLPSWWWVEVPPETCRAVPRYNKSCNVASCSIYIGLNFKL